MSRFDPKAVSNGHFAAILDAFHAEFGGKIIPSNLCKVDADYMNAQHSVMDGVTRMKVDIFTPFLGEKIASLFNANMVRIGCTTHVRVQLHKHGHVPCFNIMGDELSYLYDNGNPYFVELRDGHFSERFNISEFDKMNPHGAELPLFYDYLKTTYFPGLVLSTIINDFRSTVNSVEMSRKIYHLAAANHQVQQGQGEFEYIASIKDKRGAVSESHPFKAHNLENAFFVAKFLFNDFELLGLQKVLANGK